MGRAARKGRVRRPFLPASARTARRPQLRAVLTRQIREDLEQNIAFHLESGMPGDAASVILLYMALNWLILDRLTLPEVIPEQRVPDLIDTLVERVLSTGAAE